MSNKSSPGSKIVFLAIILTLLFLAGLYFWFNRDSVKQDRSTIKDTTIKLHGENSKNSVTLPGAKAVPRGGENVSDPNSIWYIVNKTSPITDPSFRPSDLTMTNLPSNSEKSDEERSVRSVIVPDLSAMFTAAKADGHDLMIASGYRSYDLQRVYYESMVAAYGQESADKLSAKPGQSEHQTGLALDIASVNRHCYIDECFADTPAGKWLAANSSKYGFILRYPAGKANQTGYSYEPWHFRYVGKPLAKALEASNLTLEEALPYLK